MGLKINEPYFHNFWGKKFTTYGAIFFAIILIWMIYRHYSLGVPFGMEEQKQERVEPQK